MGKSTDDLMFILRQLFLKSWKLDKEIYTIFKDFKKAYDRIHRANLINILIEFQFSSKLLNLEYV